MATRRELIGSVATRYHAGTRNEKKEILDEFVKISGFHRKHAIRVLRKIPASPEAPKPPPRFRLYDEAAEAALTILWEAADRMCGKRLKEAIPVLVEAMGAARAFEVGRGSASTATGDERRNNGSAAKTHSRSWQARAAKAAAQYSVTGTALPCERSATGNDPPPGFFEMDFVAPLRNVRRRQPRSQPCDDRYRFRLDRKRGHGDAGADAGDKHRRVY